MKYKLINSVTKKETICDKITIDGFDYYVNDEIIKDVRPYKGKWQIEGGYTLNKFPTYLTDLSECRIVIATTNPNIDIPKVLDEVDNIAYNWLYDEETENKARQGYPLKPMEYGFINGYTKSQETHPFSEEDVIGFAKECCRFQSQNVSKDVSKQQLEELLQLWKEQKPKTVYYE